ncbi:MAG: hypothetical protein DMF60_03165 [Acidobacteria bacterium]|nr:MAG: hypothetical protein DMF60_03165 [Acidobacteriota bacterium]
MLAQRTRQTNLLVTRPATLAVLLIAVLLVGSNAKLLGISVQADEEFQVSVSFADKQVAPDEPIEFRLSRPLTKAEGSIAVMVGQADLTALFTVTEKNLRYNPKTLPLPPGESQVTLYLVSPKNDWKELARFTLRVGKDALGQGSGAGGQPVSQATPTPATVRPAPDPQPPAPGTKDKLNLIPSITLSFKSQPAQSNFPLSNRPARPTFTDLNMQGSFKGEMARGLFTSQTQFDFVGASFQQEALRFGQLREQAPQIDLSSYLMQFQIGKVRYQFGHFSFGASRQLMNSFSSRGMTISFPLGNHADFAISAMNGTSIVGYSNFFGLDKNRHRLFSGTLGLELAPKRPGGLRVEVSALNAWVQPVNSFSQGSVNDAERSSGLGFRLLASDAAQRFKLDTGFARSRFTSPSDALVNQGATVKPFPSIARNARYLDASYDLLKNLTLTKDRKVNLTFGLRHERVDPLFRSLGASTQADKFSNEFSMIGTIGEINAQFTHSRFNDNLRGLPSILKSLTRANTFILGTPTSTLFGNKDKPSLLLPRLSYNFSRVHQFGAAVPVNGGFELDVGLIPNQISTNQGFTADWQIQKWRVGYRLNHSLQNNQQKGRELADLSSLVNGVAVGVAASPTLDINLDVNIERANNREARTQDGTLRMAPGVNWRMTKKSTIASSFSASLAGDAADTRRNRNIEFDIQWAYQFAFGKERFRKLSGQFFIRYADRYARTRNSIFATSDLQKNQTLNLGMSFNIF